MPELPEVETVRRGLTPVMQGRVIVHADIRRPDLRWPFPERMAERLTGARIERLNRRSKYILMDLDRGETLIVHLGMSGRMLIAGPSDTSTSGTTTPGAFHHHHPAPAKHDHVVFDMEDGTRISFNDARRFGAMDLVATDALDEHKLIAVLGPEPFDNMFSESYLAAKLAGRATPIKSALLDQRIVAGLGNIYVCEALWRAGISPTRQARDITSRQIATLTRIIRDVLNDAIAAGGSSLRDYRQANGELGYFQHSFAVYGREGEPCRTPGCTARIERLVQSGRSSFHCPVCQG
ncbi:DNA-(apurinic or apyrimidinic site) lyase [Monaibacterium marinum]|uniref:Formamidopyrimidine-DNA glycosylase n=1 Tax=Pontivivens marinum TaxID=1690039 RepID=A0A2C9CU87_9RHOB|nr:bifunctional DNA-formamidopyrimidine glycosylase/DNA-(apurinic or apyrimidinic site) lyase [Monaibacterium marinum]SOH94798.1 DNA-(apurinic or apyrimidinic site) lyase [Monaibacterium marinum]